MSKKNILQRIKSVFHTLNELNKETQNATYRVVNIEEDSKHEYQATIQVVGKNATFKMKPEEILADDRMTNQFAPCDIRTLTYLGYLGINSPKYKILAKRLSEENDKMVFAVQKKGSSKIETKTADQISTDEEILKSIDQKDAHMVGYTVATEQTLAEEKQKLRLVAQKRKLD